MNKKAQVSMFVILGIVILVLVGIFLLISNSTKPENKIIESVNEVSDFKSALSQCISLASVEAGSILASQGFMPSGTNAPHMEVPAAVLSNMNNIAIANYYVYNNQILFLSKNDVENQYGILIDKIATNCTGKLKHLEDQGYTYTMSPTSSTVQLTNEKIVVSTKLQADVTKSGKVYNVEEIQTAVNYPYYQKYLQVKNYVDYQKSKNDYLQLGYLAGLAYYNNLGYEAYYVADNATVIKITFKDYNTVGNKPLTVIFAIKIGGAN